MNPNVSHVVYRCFDAEDRLLYIGCTHDLKTRMRYHRRDTPWIGDVSRSVTEPHPDRASALRAERAAIVLERPIHNKAYAHWSTAMVAETDGAA